MHRGKNTKLGQHKPVLHFHLFPGPFLVISVTWRYVMVSTEVRIALNPTKPILAKQS